jgi:hypothetical protein
MRETRGLRTASTAVRSRQRPAARPPPCQPANGRHRSTGGRRPALRHEGTSAPAKTVTQRWPRPASPAPTRNNYKPGLSGHDRQKADITRAGLTLRRGQPSPTTWSRRLKPRLPMGHLTACAHLGVFFGVASADGRSASSPGRRLQRPSSPAMDRSANPRDSPSPWPRAQRRRRPATHTLSASPGGLAARDHAGAARSARSRPTNTVYDSASPPRARRPTAPSPALSNRRRRSRSTGGSASFATEGRRPPARPSTLAGGQPLRAPTRTTYNLASVTTEKARPITAGRA